MKHHTKTPILIICSLLLFSRLAAQEKIDFESLNAPASGNPGLVLGNQYVQKGVTFNFPKVLDYSASPGLVHSGSRAIELCYGSEFCGAELEVSFNTQQQRVKIWVGYNGPLSKQQTVIMTGFNGLGDRVATSTIVLPANSAVTPVQRPIEITSAGIEISRVIIGLLNSDLLTQFLLLDDLEFDQPGTAPPCNSPSDPQFSLTTPAEGQTFIKNVFSLQATITKINFFAQIEVVATDINGNSKKIGPDFLTTNNWELRGLTNFLFVGKNTLRIKVSDCAGSTEVTRTIFHRPDITSTVIHVIDQFGADVPGAEVYTTGKVGKTNSRGRLTVSPALEDGTLISARKMVFQKEPGELYHYSVYSTSMEVGNNGVVNKKPVSLIPDPIAEQVLQVLPSNTLIGFHLWTSIEWDASEAEINDIQNHFDGASKYLFNATDGQFFFEQVDIWDDAVKFDDRIDFRIYGNQHYHANSQRRYDAAEAEEQPYVIRLPRPPIVDSVTNFSAIDTYVHEFGHFKFWVRDEYKDGDGNPTFCTAKNPPFIDLTQMASCLMQSSGSLFKFCSERLENPHLKNTKQGATDCWSRIVERFGNTDNPPLWILKTPVTRGAIPGTINNGQLPYPEWMPKYKIENRKRPNLCEPMYAFVRDNNGNSIPNKEIWVHTTYGHDILQGRTGENGEAIPCTGIHIGDRINELTITTAGCVPVPSASVVTTSRSALRTSEIRQRPFTKLISIEPGIIAGQLKIRIQLSERQMDKSSTIVPLVYFATTVNGKEGKIPVKYNAQKKEFAGTVSNLKPFTNGRLIVTLGKEKVAMGLVVTKFIPGQNLEVSSYDGQLQVELRSKSLPGPSSIVITPSTVVAPILPNGILLGPPVQIAVTGNPTLRYPAILTFKNPGIDIKNNQEYASDYELLYFNEKANKWEPLKHTFLSNGEITAKVDQFGSYALFKKVMRN